MVNVTIKAVEGSCDADVVDRATPGNDHVQLMHLFRSGMSPYNLVACLVLKEGVCHALVVIAAEFQ